MFVFDSQVNIIMDRKSTVPPAPYLAIFEHGVGAVLIYFLLLLGGGGGGAEMTLLRAL